MAGLTQYQTPHANNAAPALGASTVTPSDSADLPDGACRSVYVGTAGDLAVVVGTTSVTFKDVSGLLPVTITRIKATGTTASNIVALY